VLDTQGWCQEGSTDARFWFNAEYLMWWTQGQSLPVPVLSTGPLDDPTTRILLGGSDPLHDELRHGARFTVGTFLDCEQRFGIEGSYFFLANRTDSRQAGSSGAPGAPVTGFPFATIDPTGKTTESFFTLANPPRFSSNTTLEMSTRLQGAELNGLYRLGSGGRSSFALLAGFRYLDLREDMVLHTLSPAIPPTPVDDFNIVDHFQTRNQFYGGQLGLRYEVNQGRFFVNGTGKIALGGVQQLVNADGLFATTLPAGTTVTPGGFFVAQTNSGRHARDQFAWVPEVTINVGANLTDHVRASVGYNFLWINNVVRPGDQVDRVQNPTQFAPTGLVGPARPAVPFNDTSFWAQGFNFGLEFRY